MVVEILMIFAGIWLLFASYNDIKKREVPNWLSFSLIIFALSFRAFYSVMNNDFSLLFYGLIGLGIFICLGYVFYYARIFAGGDAKLLMALGTVLPFSSSLTVNFMIFLAYIIFIFLVGSIYGLVYSFVLVTENRKNFSKEFVRQFKKRKIIFYISFIFAFILLIFPFYFKDLFFLAFSFIFLIFPFLYTYAKAVEEACMIKEIKSSEVTVGDWLYKEVEVGNRKIKPYWEGLSEEQVKLLRKYKRRIMIKQGIPFVPVFLISFILLFLWHSSRSFFEFGLF